jgi:very-short-patch-repair endonuclease
MMSIESRTVGWVENSYKGVIKTKRQKTIGTYRADLYFPDYKLIIECDENDHKDRKSEEELERQNYLIYKGYSMIRYDPNDKNFDGSIGNEVYS